MKKITLLLFGFVFATLSMAQNVVFEETFQSASIPATWTLLDEDGQQPGAFYADQNLFSSGTWERLNFGPNLQGAFSLASFSDSTLADPASDWLISPAIDLSSVSAAEIEVDVAGIPDGFQAAGFFPMQLELRATTSIAGTTPAASDFAGSGSLIETFEATELVEFEARTVTVPAAFVGTTVYFAFVNVAGPEADLTGVRNFRIIEYLQNDIAITGVSAGGQLNSTNYIIDQNQNDANFDYEVFACAPSGDQTISIEITNVGLDDITSFDATFVVDRGQPTEFTFSESVTLPSPLGFLETTTYDFTTGADLEADPLYFIDGYVTLAGDPNQENDSTFIEVRSPNSFDFDENPTGFFTNFQTVNFGAGGGTNNEMGWTFQDANNDGFTMFIELGEVQETFGVTPSNGDYVLFYRWNDNVTTTPANDWAFSPCLSLEAGKAYQVKLKARAGEDQGEIFPERFRLAYGTSAVNSAMTSNIIGTYDVETTSFDTYAGSFVAPTTESYHIGIHTNSTANQFYLAIDEFEVTTFEDEPVAAFGVSGTDGVDGSVFVEYCDSLVTITNNSSGIVDEVTVDWGDGSSVETFSSNQQTLQHKYTSFNTFTITVTATNALGSTQATNQVKLEALPAAVADFVIASNSNGVVTFINNSSPNCPGTNYIWDFGDNTVEQGNVTSHTYTADGTYTITLTVNNGQGSVNQFSRDVTITGLTNSISEIDFNGSFEVYPNPTNNLVNVAFQLKETQNAEVAIYGVDGRMIDLQNFSNTSDVNTQFNVSNLSEGVYIVKVTTDKGIATQKFVVSNN